MLVIGRSYWVVPIQDEEVKTEGGTKLAEETTENSVGETKALADNVETDAGITETDAGITGVDAGTGASAAGTKLTTRRGGRTAGTKTGVLLTGL